MKDPADCRNMAELRAAIDLLDGEIVALFARRAGYIDRAIQLKPDEQMPARIATRVEDVVAKVRLGADRAGLDPDLAEAVWRQVIDWSIAREEVVLGHGPQDAGAAAPEGDE